HRARAPPGGFAGRRQPADSEADQLERLVRVQPTDQRDGGVLRSVTAGDKFPASRRQCRGRPGWGYVAVVGMSGVREQRGLYLLPGEATERPGTRGLGDLPGDQRGLLCHGLPGGREVTEPVSL